MNLSHRTDQRHRRAITQAANVAPRHTERYPEGLPSEMALGLQMQMEAAKTRKRNNVSGLNQNGGPSQKRVFAALKRPMRVDEISKTISLGVDSVRSALQKMEKNGTARKRPNSEPIQWERIGGKE